MVFSQEFCIEEIILNNSNPIVPFGNSKIVGSYGAINICHETFSIRGVAELTEGEVGGGRELAVEMIREDGSTTTFQVRVRLDTPQ